MPQKSYDILAVGNAIIDVFSQCDDDFLQQHSIEKGGMNLQMRRHLNRFLRPFRRLRPRN
ncbi:MAG: hypothetical protein CM15mP46_6810 [Alphaproteobacteria bacterium]|nr:MAG: hypothetical protein CM15mP46_6810 [Alphaproteobacteria bacterium]